MLGCILIIFHVSVTDEDDIPPVKSAGTVLGRIFTFLCGASHDRLPDTADSVVTRHKMLKEIPFWRNFLNVNAMIALAVMCWLMGFFH